MSDEPEAPINMRGPLAWMANNGVAANVLMLVLIVGGLVTLATGIKQEVFPEVELDRVVIEVVYPGASPAEIEQGVVLAIEEAVRGVDGVREVRSSSLEGVAKVGVELLLGTDKDRALSDVKSAVDRITSFPQDSERPVVSLASNRQQVISIVLFGDVDEATLRKLGEKSRRELLRDPRITVVELSGIRPLEISVEVPQAELRKHNLTLDQIAERITAASVEVPGGGVKTSAGEVLLRTTERRDRGDEYENIVILSRPDGTQVRLKDIATVKDGFQENDRAATFNGKRAVMVNVFRVGAETPLTVAAAAKDYAAELQTSLPEGLEVTTWGDTSEMYAGRIELLVRNARIGLLLVLFVLGLFLEGRLAFWVTLGIPVSFAGSLLFFPVADVSINMISLFAFIITLGMVVDDAIVIGEAIHMKRAQGMKRLDAAVEGVREVAQPVIFAILTSCVAFAPMLMVPGVMGKFFRVVPIVVISVLLISLAESLLVLPAHLSHPMPWWLRAILAPYLWVMRQVAKLGVPARLERFVFGPYERLLRDALRRRLFTLAAGVSLVIFTAGIMVAFVPFTFLPAIENDVITAQLKMTVGTPVEQTERVTERMSAIAYQMLAEQDEGRDDSILRGLYQEIGAATTIEVQVDGAGDNVGSHLSTVMVYLVDAGDRELSSSQFAEEWRKRIGEIPGAESLTFHYKVGVQPGAPVDVQLIHDDLPTLEAAAEELAEEIRVYDWLADIQSGVSRGKQQLDFRLTDAGKAQGLTEFELARQVRAAFFGAEAVRQQRGRDEVRVYVRRPLEERRSLNDVENLVIRTPSGGEMPLAQAAKLTFGSAPRLIRRVNGRRSISVTADLSTLEANANQVVAGIKSKELPELLASVPGLRHSFGGEQQRQAESTQAIFLGFGLAIIVMFSMLAVAFRSYSQPALVMSVIPFGMVGAVWGHVMMGFDISMMSLMGLVALSGVVVNDSLILIVAINRYRDDGMDMVEAVVAGCTRRFRPILLTSLTTFFGLAPMIVETSVQARFLVPMAVSLGFGVLGATFIMLLIVPCAYLTNEDLRRVVGNFFARLRGQPTEYPPTIRPSVPPSAPSIPPLEPIDGLSAEE